MTATGPFADRAWQTAAFWTGNGLGARSVRFTLTAMAPFAAVFVLGEGVWIAFALLVVILGFMLDTGGSARARLRASLAGGLVVTAGTAIGTAASGSEGLTACALALAGVFYALVESLGPSAAFAARFLCIGMAVGALYVPLQPVDVAIIFGFAVYGWGVSVLWDRLTGVWRPRTGPTFRDVVAHIRASRAERFAFAAIVAATVALAFAASTFLDLHRSHWTLLAIVVALKADPDQSRAMIGDFLIGTVIGVAVALAFGMVFSSPKELVVGMTLAALARWPAQQIHTRLGVAAITVFVLLILHLVALLTHTASHAPLDRVVDVAVGCAFALVALHANIFVQGLIARTRPPANPGSLA